MKQLDNVLNNILQTITQMPPPLHQTTEDNPITESRVTNTPAPKPRVENNAEALTPNTSPTPEPPFQRPGNDKETRNCTRELLRTILQQSKINRAQIIQWHQMQLRRSERMEQAKLIHDKDTGEWLTYRQLLHDPKHRENWLHSAANEFGCLANGIGGRYKGTNTIFFIDKSKVLYNRMKDIMYISFRCDYKPNKEEKWITRLTMGGESINYPDGCGTPTADMLLFKILLNSIVSTKGAKCLIIDIKDFYLKIPMKRYEYMRFKISDIPDEIIKEYKLDKIVTADGYIYCEIWKGMYGLPQAGIIAQELLEECLAKHGYHQSKIIHGFWKHKTRPICFTLVVDNFAIKYTNKRDVEHLVNILKQDYDITIDREAKKYIGLTMEWDLPNQQVHTHMPGYLDKTLIHFKHEAPKKRQNSPHPHIAPTYGAKTQYTKTEEAFPPLNKEDTKYIQAVTGTLLYYRQEVDTPRS